MFCALYYSLMKAIPTIVLEVCKIECSTSALCREIFVWFCPSSRVSPGVNFINVLRAAFTLVDPESAKRTDNLSVFFIILELRT